MTKPLTQSNPPTRKAATPQSGISEDISNEILFLRLVVYRLLQIAISERPLRRIDLWKLVILARMLIVCFSRLSRLAPTPTQRKMSQEAAISRLLSQTLAEMADGFPP